MSEQTQGTQEATDKPISEVTPAQNETTDTKATDSTATPPKDETWEYNGDRKAVPKEFEKYVKALDRYVSKKDQTLAETNKRLQEYEAKLKEFQNPKPSNTSKEEQPQPFVTQDEIDAIALGDAKTLEAVIERKAKALLEANVSPMKNEMKSLAMERQEREAAATISAFSDLHPDFQELLKSPAGEYMVNAAKQGMDIETIYKNAAQIRDHFFAAADEKRKADLEAKKAGTVVGKSMPGTSEVVYVDNADEQRRMALELTMKGDKRQVHIRPKKR
jgi:hypothetical protein